MKKTLPSFATCTRLLFALISTTTAVLAQQADAPSTANSTALESHRTTLAINNGAGQGGPVASPAGQALARRAIVAVDAQRSLYLKLRQRINMFDQQLVGNGIYQQLEQGEARRLRLDLKVNIANQTTSMQQVCDGRFLYIRREFGDASHLGRVDLRRIRDAIDSSDAAEGNIDVSQQGMLLGGMPQLLTRLEKNFQFTEPRAATLETTPVTVIEGYWKPEALLALVPDKKEAIDAGKPISARELSGQLPTQIRLIVRTEDSFPLRIEYLRSGKAVGDAPPPVTTIMAMEFYDIRAGVHIDPLTFTYNPGNQEVADHTEVYLTSLGLKPTRHATREKEPPR